ncbi:MAG: thymidine kinase [Deltaproteobacteria bacterium]|jgi:thymidine kinase|nr:thymidine kinase [Deltaproteobacteria bacterium]MBT4265474.1 thymidine kinase [Deltaproteobacteria bacterium]MBT4638088.1 thymidine kinase [Deltaproteobacteria bacterium]MBT6499998.1 thymidine kinase [Deltaproteobacteria bacterium]MBT7154745.1 thymidine kinase [Deltaproteobacteria bacterium]
MSKLYFYYSTMNAGKTTSLLQSSYNYHERGMKTLLYTAVIDDRYGVGKIKSRIGLEADANLFGPDDDLFKMTSEKTEEEKIDCVLLDEAQFLSRDQVFQLTEVTDRLGIPVLAFGLRTDFLGNLFEGSQALLAWADELKELKTICHCGKKATMVVRMDENNQAVREGSQIEIGGNDRYISLCRKHFKEQVIY